MLHEGSGLSLEIIDERGYRSISSAAELRALGFSASQARVPALLVPLWDVTGVAAAWSLRPDHPRSTTAGKISKYEQPWGATPILDIPPRCQAALADPTVPIFVTEGAKKADALAQLGAASISLSGVWNWRGKNELGGKSALPDWETVALNGRLVRIVFDSDVTTKLPVSLALARLKAFLTKRGANVEVVYLPDGPGGIKQGVDDFFVAGGTLEELATLATGELRQPNRENEGELPEIVVNGRFLPAIADDCWKLVVSANHPRPTIFARGNRLVSVRLDDDGRVFLKEWTDDDVPFVLERLARFVRVGPEEQGSPRIPAGLPKRVIADIQTAWNKPVPHIRGLVHTPVFDINGVLNTTPGYQPDTRLFYHSVGSPVPSVPLIPKPEEVDAAKRLLLGEWLVDFRFGDDASRVHALAAALTPLVREMISGPTPLMLIDAPIQGSGKGLLAQTIGVIVTGDPPAVMTQPRDQDEERKRITAVLRDASPVILIDNVKHRLDSPVLAGALTSDIWGDRLLGASESLRLPNRALWLATGNNVELDGEIGRRTVPIRIDPRVDLPWERSGFKHNPLLRWVTEQRPLLLHALLTLVQHWIASGRPAFGGPTLGSYESWCEIIGGVLQCCGAEGFLTNREDLYKRADSETEEWRDFAYAWWEAYGSGTVKAGDLARVVRQHDLLPGLLATVRGEVTDQAVNTRLGKALAKRRDRRVAKFFIRLPGRDSHQKGTFYALELAEDPEPRTDSSAQAPRDFRPFSDSTAELAEDAEDNSYPHARSGCAEVGPPRSARPGHASAIPPPQPPQLPRSDSILTQDRAEVPAEDWAPTNRPPQQSFSGTPRCDECGLEMSVVRVGTVCGACKRNMHA